MKSWGSDSFKWLKAAKITNKWQDSDESTASSLLPQVLHLQFQTTLDWTQVENFQKVPKSKTWICLTPATIYTVFTLYLQLFVVVVQSLSRVWLFVTPRTAAYQASLSFTISWSLLKLMSIESIMPSNQVILHRSLLLSSIFSSIRVFSNESALHVRGPNYWSSSFSISPSNEYSGLISFRINWLDILAVQGYFKDGGVEGWKMCAHLLLWEHQNWN